MSENGSRVTQTPFLMIPMWLWDQMKAAPTVLTAYMELRALVYVGAERDERRADLVRTLMDRTGLGRSAAYSALQWLEAAGGIEWRNGERLFLPLDPPSTTMDDTDDPSIPVDVSSTTTDKSSTTMDDTSSIEGEENPLENDTSTLRADDVGALCEQLAEKVATQQDGRRPPITERWRKDMRLLLERGPLHQDTPEQIGVERVSATIDYVFEHMTTPQGRGGFCWAAQVRSPGALRDHWHQMADAARRQRAGERGASASAIDRVVARETAATAGTLFDQAAAGVSMWQVGNAARAALGAGR